MPLYWFFDLEKVATSHLYLSELENTETFYEAVDVFNYSRLLFRKEDAHLEAMSA